MIPNGFRRIALAHCLLPSHTSLTMPSSSFPTDGPVFQTQASSAANALASESLPGELIHFLGRPESLV